MAGLDQGGHPMRFAVAASTVSGLLVAALTAAAGPAFRWWSAWHALLPLLVLGLALAALPLLLHPPGRWGRAPRRVFLIVAAFTHAVLFHQGAPALGEGALRSEQGLAALREAAASCLSPAGQAQVTTALEVTAALEERLHAVRHQLLTAAPVFGHFLTV